MRIGSLIAAEMAVGLRTRIGSVASMSCTTHFGKHRAAWAPGADIPTPLIGAIVSIARERTWVVSSNVRSLGGTIGAPVESCS